MQTDFAGFTFVLNMPAYNSLLFASLFYWQVDIILLAKGNTKKLCINKQPQNSKKAYIFFEIPGLQTKDKVLLYEMAYVLLKKAINTLKWRKSHVKAFSAFHTY